MDPIPQTAEVDLIKIRTIKKKHVEQILEPYSPSLTQASWQGIKFLAYMPSSDSILAVNLDNGHLRAVRVMTYIASMQNGESGEAWTVAAQNARSFANSLPQLFLD